MRAKFFGCLKFILNVESNITKTIRLCLQLFKLYEWGLYLSSFLLSGYIRSLNEFYRYHVLLVIVPVVWSNQRRLNRFPSSGFFPGDMSDYTPSNIKNKTCQKRGEPSFDSTAISSNLIPQYAVSAVMIRYRRADDLLD